MKRRYLLAGIIVGFMFLLIFSYVFISYGVMKPDKGHIADGVKISGIDVGGKTKEEAMRIIDENIAKMGNRAVNIDVNGVKINITQSQLGYAYSETEAIEKAVNVGNKKTMMDNYRELGNARKGTLDFEITTMVDVDVMKDYVKKNCKSLCKKAKNAKIKMKDGKLVYTESRDGVDLDVDDSVTKIRTAIENANANDTVDVVLDVEVDKPKYDKALVSKCKDKLGSFTTSFNSGNINRTKNLANAAKHINGKVVYPGQTFSVHDAISPLTEENGYFAAASYNNGKVEDSLGGGVCQVATTLYNAVLRAELEVVERSPHSMMVSYVKPSMDAAIAGDYKDFKFKNNTKVPIFLEGGTYGAQLYFNVYGAETRDGDRTVTFESETIDTIEPGDDKVTYDSTKPETYVEVTQAAHTGCKARLWKIVTQNGKTEKIKVNQSTYSAVPRYVVKGTKKDEPEETAAPATTKKPTTSGKKTQTNTANDTANSGSTGNSSATDNSAATTGTDNSAASSQAEAAGNKEAGTSAEGTANE